jgi:hypothetical protein
MARLSPINSTSAQLTAIERLAGASIASSMLSILRRIKLKSEGFGSLMVEGSTSVFTAQLAGAMDKRVML